jgi:cytochrome c biogenesis factor
VKSLLLFSVVLAAIALPAFFARDARPRRGFKRMLLALFIANTLYLAYLTLVHPFVFIPRWP